jgi:hypothetical protein
MIQVFVFVPEDYKEVVKSAMFEAGGGRMGHYDSCCFEHAGVGQFRPLEGSHAFMGQIGEIEKVREVKIEMICEERLFEEIIKAMRSVHPYEEPAFYGIKTVRYSV